MQAKRTKSTRTPVTLSTPLILTQYYWKSLKERICKEKSQSPISTNTGILLCVSTSDSILLLDMLTISNMNKALVTENSAGFHRNYAA